MKALFEDKARFARNQELRLVCIFFILFFYCGMLGIEKLVSPFLTNLFCIDTFIL